jgi:hypothetical protein
MRDLFWQSKSLLNFQSITARAANYAVEELQRVICKKEMTMSLPLCGTGVQGVAPELAFCIIEKVQANI